MEKLYYIHSKKLGEGGFGKVKLATHLLTKQKVAIKIIEKEKIQKDLFRIRTEVKALTALRHPGIAKLLQVIENDSMIYLVMEYCSGGELFDHLVNKKRLGEPETRRIIKSLLTTLAYVHSKGFAHRDIKPENVMFDSSLNIKLIDFGLAANSSESLNKSLDSLTTCCGSPAYVAPELLSGKNYSGPAADVWSTGVLIFTLLCGRLPFSNPNLALLYKKITSCDYQMPLNLTNSAKNLIAKMLCVDPLKRITIPEIMEHPWIKQGLTNTTNGKVHQDESELEEKILLKCLALFPGLDLAVLRKLINDVNTYQSATYWLVKQKPEDFKDVEFLAQNSNRRRSISFLSSLKPLKFAKVSEDLNSKENNHQLPVAEKNLLSVKKTEPFSITRKKEIWKTPLNDKCIIEKPTDSKKKPGTKLFRGVNRNLFNEAEKSSHSDRKPLIPIEKKSNLVEDSSKKSSQTPKRSLFKRLLENATPCKVNHPRRFTSTSKSENIILTDFKDVNECINKIVQLMKNKFVNCQTKNFTIRCVLSSRDVIILVFELELMVCRNTSLIGIQHKRLRGDSWDYLRICEELEKIHKEK